MIHTRECNGGQGFAQAWACHHQRARDYRHGQLHSGRVEPDVCVPRFHGPAPLHRACAAPRRCAPRTRDARGQGGPGPRRAQNRRRLVMRSVGDEVDFFLRRPQIAIIFNTVAIKWGLGICFLAEKFVILLSVVFLCSACELSATLLSQGDLLSCASGRVLFFVFFSPCPAHRWLTTAGFRFVWPCLDLPIYFFQSLSC